MATAKNTKALMLYLNNRVVLEALSDAERGRLILSLLDYLETGALPAFDGALGMAFVVLRNDVDRSVERWEEECARRSAAGKKSAALRAAKKFAQSVSCKDDDSEDYAPDEAEEAMLTDAEQTSTVFNGVEVPSGTGTYQNQNQNPNQNQNQNQNPNQKQNQNPKPKSDQTPKTDTPSSAVLPSGGRERDFARFWQAYPRKVGKQAARKAFQQVSAPLETLLSALERQRGDPQWQRENGRFIPHPITWLNQARWEDEPVSPSAADCRAYGVESL